MSSTPRVDAWLADPDNVLRIEDAIELAREIERDLRRCAFGAVQRAMEKAEPLDTPQTTAEVRQACTFKWNDAVVPATFAGHLEREVAHWKRMYRDKAYPT